MDRQALTRLPQSEAPRPGVQWHNLDLTFARSAQRFSDSLSDYSASTIAGSSVRRTSARFHAIIESFRSAAGAGRKSRLALALRCILIKGVGRSAFIGGRRAPAVIRAGGVWARRWSASRQQQQSDKEYEFHGFFSFCGCFRSLSLSLTSFTGR